MEDTHAYFMPFDRAEAVIDAVDLFCGAGGLSCGLRKAGVNVKMGVEIDERCRYAYEHNNRAKMLTKSVTELTGGDVWEQWEGTHVSLLAGCPPCQTFSTLNHRKKAEDPRNFLAEHFLRVIVETLPNLVALENVPPFAQTPVFKHFVEELRTWSYHVDWRIVYCPDYGLPQSRKRVILLASRLGEIKVPEPTYAKPPTVREMIGDLPPLKAGEQCPDDRFHVCGKLSPLNLERIRQSRQGGTWKDWDERLLPPRFKRGNTFFDVYGRMSWDKPAPTMTTEFRGYGNGRFGHPEQDRPISIREGAIFQGFPRDYEFLPPGSGKSLTLLAKMIGNAVPVGLGELIGKALVAHVNEWISKK